MKSASNQTHPCTQPGCPNTVQYDDEPYCFTHSPDSGSSVKGYSYRASQLQSCPECGGSGGPDCRCPGMEEQRCSDDDLRSIAHVQGYRIPEGWDVAETSIEDDAYCPHGELKVECPECETERLDAPYIAQANARMAGGIIGIILYENQTDRRCFCEDYPCCGH